MTLDKFTKKIMPKLFMCSVFFRISIVLTVFMFAQFVFWFSGYELTIWTKFALLLQLFLGSMYVLHFTIREFDLNESCNIL